MLTQLGITYPQYLVLTVLWEKDSQPVNDIARRLLLETNTVTPLLQRMERQGLLCRKQGEQDKRQQLVSLTEQGKALEEQAFATREAKNCIPKRNQEYVLRVAFNVLGSYTYTSRYIKQITDEFNAKMPVGYRCLNRTSGWYEDTGEQWWLIGLIVIIIYFVCAILFESLRLPLVIISLIPVSFIGTFLTYWITGVEFDTGGFASLVLLCGLTVNAGIYILAEYQSLRNNHYNQQAAKATTPNPLREGQGVESALYVRAYNHKIMAVFMTIFSTVLGLIPFFIDGKSSPFWFSFAVGATGGLLFSILALVFVMPIFLKLRHLQPSAVLQGS